MKNLRKIVLPLAGFAMLGSLNLRADDAAGTPTPPPPGAHHEHRDEMRENFKRMVKDLDLSADQQIQIEAIHKQTAEQLKAVRGDASLTDDQKHAKSRELRKSTEEQVRAVLTPEQQAKAKELREKHGRHGPGDHPSPPSAGEAPPPAPAN